MYFVSYDVVIMVVDISTLKITFFLIVKKSLQQPYTNYISITSNFQIRRQQKVHEDIIMHNTSWMICKNNPVTLKKLQKNSFAQ